MLLRQNPNGRPNKPVMVMLHGSGSSGTILGIQSHFIVKELSKSFDLFFLDGPIRSAPGPGVLPLFADMPGYYRWLQPACAQTSPTMRLAELFDVSRHIETQLLEHGIDPPEVEAMLGFSQGALTAMALLGMRHVGQSVFQNLRFCVSIGGGTTGNEAQLDGIENMISMASNLSGRDDGKFPGYMVHAIGVKDLWYADSRRLASMSPEEKSIKLDYRDGHVMPRQKLDVIKLLKAIAIINKKSKLEDSHIDEISAAALESLPPLLTASGDFTTALAMLMANGIKV